MKKFKEFLLEVVNFKDNILYVMDGKRLRTHDTRVKPNQAQDEDDGEGQAEGYSETEHPNVFPEFNFMGRGENSENKRPASAWGRIDPNNKTFHIVTQHGIDVGGRFAPVHASAFKRDIQHRMNVLDAMQRDFPDHRVDVGVDAKGKPITHSIDQHRSYLMDHLHNFFKEEEPQLF